VTPADVDRLLTGTENARIAVVGDVMLDAYTWGRVNRISPEAPVPVVEIVSQTSSPGGAANAAACVAALGVRTTLFGTIGDDLNGRTLCGQLDALGIDAQMTVTPDEPTVTKHRIWSGSQQLLRVDAELRPSDGVALDRLQAVFDPRGFDAVLVSDYDKGAVDAASCRWLIGTARAADVPVLVDPKSADYDRYRGATVIKPNEREALAAFLARHGTGADHMEIGRYLVTEIADAAILTRGADGVDLFCPDHHHLPVRRQNVYDVTGAGDVVAAVITVGLALGWDLIAACRLANAAARISVSRIGTGGVSRDEILHDLASIE
jgi:D-beta-D-heptose 7-phosphate kinase/D-beta-D-heptose 1-phosphate adenosyltransferase